MPVSQETAARADHPVQTPVYDRDAYIQENQLDSAPLHFPSDTVKPGVVDEAPQQGATEPGSGSTVPASDVGGGGVGIGGGESDQRHEPSFKEKVIGYAKKTRGATLGNSETKEQGERILAGEEVFEPKKVGPGSALYE
ncbi:hypothetical protein BXZ70DRAFT_559867 [Cristinia sonorae]|uniref:Uncharacterized protein n=1 Tax=Cristinia sonorae TaxID=1940300 RepID=A0A8K0UFK6_9AGAR|nr:hypothetical protein BXZ70DRAFT_559867 [Cristinia sonorae]